jgi:hypothetical protein
MVEKISNPQLTAQEEEWLNRILAVPTPIHPLLYSQINAATIEREYNPYYIFLRFRHPSCTEQIPALDSRVPINMIIQHTSSCPATVRKVLYQDRYSMEVEVGDDDIWPTEFLLHILDGYVLELEIYNVDSSLLDLPNLCKGYADYSIIPQLENRKGDKGTVLREPQ